MPPTLLMGNDEKQKGKAILLNDQGGGVMNVEKDVSATLRSEEHGHAQIYLEPKIGEGNMPVLHNCQLWDEPENDLSPCLRARMGTGGNSTPMVPEERKGMSGHYVLRRITPLEYERLQGFCDGHTDVPWKGKEHAPDAPRYKALGNSMAVPVMRWIGKRIDEALAHPITEDKSDKIDWQPDLFGF